MTEAEKTNRQAQLAHDETTASRLREAEDLATIGRAANSTLELSEIYPSVAAALENYVQFDRIAISLRHENGTTRRVFVSGVGEDVLGAESITVEDEEALDRQPDGSLIVARPGKEMRAGGTIEKLGLLSWAEVSINSPQGLVGYLSVRSKQADAYSEIDIERLRKAADQIAPAIVNAQLFDQSRQETELRSVLADVARIATSALDIGEVYDEIARAILRVVPADRLVVSSYQENGTVGSTEFAEGVEMEGYQIGASNPIPPDVAEFIFDFKAPFLVDDAFIEKHPALNKIYQDGRANGFNTWLIAPLIWKDKAIGGLHFRHRFHYAYSENHVRVAGLIAQQISGAVASSLDYRRERRKNEINTALANIAVVTSRANELELVYSSVADEVSRLMHYDRFAVVLFDRETDRLRVDYARGLIPEGDYTGVDVTHPSQERTWQWYLEQNLDPVPVPRDIAMEKLGLKSWIQAPFGMRADGPDGIISLRSLNENEYTESDKAVLTEIARQITPVIQNVQLFEQSQKLTEQRERAKVLDEENIELQRIADARSEFLSTVSHELRTPLTSIAAFSDILGRNRPNNLEENQLEQVAAIKRASNTLTGLIDDLLDVSRADVQKLSITRSPFLFNELLDDVATETNRTLADKNQNLEISRTDGEITIDADQSRITQVLNNLISNASKYSPEGSTIAVGASAANGKLTVKVTDSGNGIAPNDLSSVYTPFFRAADQQTQREQGTGLGLTIVKTIIDLHAGEIQIDSQLGQGTTVTFWIPGILPS